MKDINVLLKTPYSLLSERERARVVALRRFVFMAHTRADQLTMAAHALNDCASEGLYPPDVGIKNIREQAQALVEQAAYLRADAEETNRLLGQYAMQGTEDSPAIHG